MNGNGQDERRSESRPWIVDEENPRTGWRRVVMGKNGGPVVGTLRAIAIAVSVPALGGALWGADLAWWTNEHRKLVDGSVGKPGLIDKLDKVDRRTERLEALAEDRKEQLDRIERKLDERDGRDARLLQALLMNLRDPEQRAVMREQGFGPDGPGRTP